MVVEKPQYLYKVNLDTKEIEILTKAIDILENCYDEIAEFDYCVMPDGVFDTETITDSAEEIRNFLNIVGVCTIKGYDRINPEELK